MNSKSSKKRKSTPVSKLIEITFRRIFLDSTDAINLLLQQSAGRYFVPIDYRRLLYETPQFSWGQMAGFGSSVALNTRISDDVSSTIIVYTDMSVPLKYICYTNEDRAKEFKVPLLSAAVGPYRRWVKKLVAKYDNVHSPYEPEDEVEIPEILNYARNILRDPRIDVMIQKTKDEIDQYDGALRTLRRSEAINNALDNIRKRFARLQEIRGSEHTEESYNEVNDIENQLEMDISDIITLITQETALYSNFGRMLNPIYTTKYEIGRKRKSPSKRKTKPKKSIKRKTRKSPSKRKTKLKKSVKKSVKRR